MFKYMSTEINNYKTYKEKLDTALTSAADNMVRVGYLLMQARDTDILSESGYSGMGDFAKSEYGLSPDQTSRFISIAERFGDGEGRLQDQWQQFGYSKLSEMLTLPDKVNEALSPEVTREEIRELKAEVKEEEKITPVEATIEQWEEKMKDPDVENTPMVQRLFKEYFREFQEDFEKAITRLNWDDYGEHPGERKAKNIVLDGLAPNGIRQISARIPGPGRFMLSFKGEDALPTLVGIRDSTSTEIYWEDVYNGLHGLVKNLEADWDNEEPEKVVRGMWQQLYGEPFPKTEKTEPKKEKTLKIAPAQPKKETKKPEKKEEQQIKVTGTKEEVKDAPGQQGGGTVQIVESEAPEQDFMNEPEEVQAGDEDNLPRKEREAKIEEYIKLINRAALDLQRQAGKMEKLTKNFNWFYVSDLALDTDRLWDKVMADLSGLAKLLKMRMDADEEEEQE